MVLTGTDRGFGRVTAEVSVTASTWIADGGAIVLAERAEKDSNVYRVIPGIFYQCMEKSGEGLLGNCWGNSGVDKYICKSQSDLYRELGVDGPCQLSAIMVSWTTEHTRVWPYTAGNYLHYV